jgi:hypothetical protein
MLNLNEQICAEVDDEIYNLTKRIQKDKNLTWEEARDNVNNSLRLLMCSYREIWDKK